MEMRERVREVAAARGLYRAVEAWGGRPRILFVVTQSLMALLALLPGILVALATASLLYGRALATVAWLWPITLLAFAVQAIYATARGLPRSACRNWRSERSPV